MTHQQTLFLAACLAWKLPAPEPEYKFMPTRRWRLDFAWIDFDLGLEIQGGLFIKGRHTRGAALKKEYEKLNALCCLGWRVLYVLPEQVESGEAFALVKEALKGAG